MATEREKEREAELESAMYTNCLLLGIDSAIIGGGGGGSPRVGHFRHSNPRMGEHLLHFLLSALRGPAQSAKDFDKVWPIFDSGQSRDFRKIVQGIISELESQGALPRSNSRVSSLATCCGPRFVELLWQLSVHALREVHRRTFDADVASNPLPASLTDISYLHAAALLPITKARIAIERRKFLKNADIVVRRQTTWSNLAHEMTAEFRGLCAEEAYLQQELEKLQDMRNKANFEGELWDDRVSSSSSQNIHLVSKATRLWESVLARKSQHEALASGPIEDLIAHREHRYRISGSSLLAAMDSSSHVPYSNVICNCDGEMNSPIYNREQTEPGILGSNETLSRADGGSGRVQPTVDVAEILRRWTHALQRIHKQSLQLAKANDGEGPELLRCASDSGNGDHAESLATTLAEHRQHLVSIQELIDQLKEVVPAMQKSIEDLTEEVNIISPVTMDEYTERSTSSTQAQSSGRLANSANEVLDATSKFSFHLNNASTGPALKLPHLFSLTPSLLGKGMQMPKQEATVTQSTQTKSLKAEKFVDPPFSNDHSSCAAKDSDDYYVANLRRSVREVALSRPSTNCNLSEDKSSGDESEHFFIPLSTRLPLRKEIDAIPNRRKQRLASPSNIRGFKGSIHPSNNDRHLRSVGNALNHSNGHLENTHLVNEPRPTVELDRVDFGCQRTSYVVDESLDQMFSSPLLMDSPLFLDTYDDLLAPLSETDAALMER